MVVVASGMLSQKGRKLEKLGALRWSRVEIRSNGQGKLEQAAPFVKDLAIFNPHLLLWW